MEVVAEGGTVGGVGWESWTGKRCVSYVAGWLAGGFSKCFACMARR